MPPLILPTPLVSTAWLAEHLGDQRRAGRKAEYGHVTRMVPKRIPEILEGGSLYWVIKGAIQCRQTILDVQPFVDRDGIGRCRIVMDHTVVRTEWRPRRPFQGWRYLDPKDAPPDLKAGRVADDLPPALMAELSALGLR